MTQVQTVRQPNPTCRWRIWRTYDVGASKFATREVAEHFCDGEFLWIALDTPDGTTWMIDDDPVTLMEVISDVPPSMAEWVIDQTVAGLGGLLMELLGLDVGDDGAISSRRSDPDDHYEQFARMAGLMTELVRFANAGSVADKLEALRELVEREHAQQTDVRPAAA